MTTTTTALVTGANKGLGRETVRRLGELGWQVFLGARDAERGKRAAAELTEQGWNVEFVQLDVTSVASIEAAVAAVRERTQALDVLINNAGIPGNFLAPEQTQAEDLRPVFETNVFAPVQVTRAFLPLLRAAAHPRVVMVSSGMGSLAVTSDPERLESSLPNLNYSPSKAALNMIMSQYSRALPEIRFNAADPGYTATDFNNNGGYQTVTEGTDAIIELATAGPDGPTGGYFDRQGRLPW
ncbi:putative oxidoreductase [Nocardia brasiliensis NBRC 14402]|uniref:SDR family oxidoreductase n=1 Tax=Nocardia brasiliensis TaxID=37326 RepID=UPI0002E90713|nr:SDR family oxidoreductase [Nocardia brasiliensis]ASF06850.1 SDR family NAD(P)-dependent oxidoreductase [Nocardia brasiliensis]GAJ85291.1 putative oxidoreductase [Nocardia brasiliensis NBRC 14402]SUB47938.1 Putative ketoacyl reductase [Nocardia brasiliensis]